MDIKSSNENESDKTIRDKQENNKARFFSTEMILGALLFCCLLFALVALHFRVSAPQPSAAQPVDSQMEAAFWARDWARMDAIEKSEAILTSKDISLYVNALWIQGRYPQGLEILEKGAAIFPSELASYAGMFKVLGYERVGRRQEAYATAKKLMDGSAPTQLRYYLAYALGRLAKAEGKNEESLDWFRKMWGFAGERKQGQRALEEIIKFQSATLNEAAELLILSPHHAVALKKCRDAGATTPKVAYALGYNAYLRKNYSGAIKWFAQGARDPHYGEGARYYKAYSHYRLKENGEALTLWGKVALEGREYPQRSVQRLRSLAQRGHQGAVVDALDRVARSRDEEEVVAEALGALILLADGEAQSRAEAELLRRYPKSRQSATRYWEKGLSQWKEKNIVAALGMWQAGSAAKPRDLEIASRLGYWQVRALLTQNRTDEARKLSQELQERYPFEYYTLLLNPAPALHSGKEVPPDQQNRSLLEDWGFVSYARADYARDESAQSHYRLAQLAKWSGDYPTSARQATLFLRKLEGKPPVTRELAECLYPKAFEAEVRAASAKTGLAPSVIWGIMRQESMYEPHVVSSAGAYGLMQLMPATARGESKRMKLPEDAYLKPAGNVLLGANHMVGLLAGFKETPLALAAYNAGGTPVKRWSREGIGDINEWTEAIPYNETRNYVKAVMGNIHMYRALYGDAKPVSADAVSASKP